VKNKNQETAGYGTDKRPKAYDAMKHQIQ